MDLDLDLVGCVACLFEVVVEVGVLKLYVLICVLPRGNVKLFDPAVVVFVLFALCTQRMIPVSVS
jgi:hypothetical protein